MANGARASGLVCSAAPSLMTSAVSRPDSLDLWVQHSSPSRSRSLRQWSVVSATTRTGRPLRRKVTRMGWSKLGPARQKVFADFRETKRGTGCPEGVSRRMGTAATELRPAPCAPWAGAAILARNAAMRTACRMDWRNMVCVRAALMVNKALPDTKRVNLRLTRKARVRADGAQRAVSSTMDDRP